MRLYSLPVVSGVSFILAIIDFIAYQFSSKHVSSEIRCMHILVFCVGLLSLYALVHNQRLNHGESSADPVTSMLKGWCAGAFCALAAIAAFLLSSDHTLHVENANPNLGFHAFTVALSAGVTEEIVFRGILLTLLKKLFSKMCHGVLIAGLIDCGLFILSHYNQARSPFFYGLVFVWSVLLTVSALRTRALWLPIGLHTGYDTVQTVAGGVHVPALASMKGLLYIQPEYLPYSFGLHAIVAVLLLIVVLRYKSKHDAAHPLRQYLEPAQ
jgi:membrane protease YdiL (CAAX protease family)